MALKIGFDIFAGSSQAGTDSSVSGVLQAETVVRGKHKVEVQRNSDSFYWNATSEAFQAGQPAEADELDFTGSYSPSGKGPGSSRLRLSMRLPQELIDLSTAAGLTIMVYPTGEQATGTPTTASLVTDFLP